VQKINLGKKKGARTQIGEGGSGYELMGRKYLDQKNASSEGGGGVASVLVTPAFPTPRTKNRWGTTNSGKIRAVSGEPGNERTKFRSGNVFGKSVLKKKGPGYRWESDEERAAHLREKGSACWRKAGRSSRQPPPAREEKKLPQERRKTSPVQGDDGASLRNKDSRVN